MRWLVVLIGLILILLFSGIRLADPDPVRTIRHSYFDSLQRVYPRDWQSLPVRVVDLDEASLAQIGQWPWPRSTLAELTDRLRGYGASVVAYDMLFAEPDRYSPGRLLEAPGMAGIIDLPDDPRVLERLDTDLAFADALGRMPTVLSIASGAGGSGPGPPYDKAGFVQIGTEPMGSVSVIPRTTPIVPALAEAATGIGVINRSPLDSSDIVRRVPLVWQGESGPLPALSVETLRAALGQGTYIVRGLADLERAMASLTVGGYTIPTSATGELWVHYRRDDPRLYVSAADVLSPEPDPDLAALLQGHIVLVGTSAAGLLDIRTTALGERVPGVAIHAQVLEQILTDSYLLRSDVIAALEVLSHAVLGLILTAVMARLGPLASVVTGGLGAIAVLAASHVAFARMGLLFDASFPMLAGLLTYGILTAYQVFLADQEKRMIRRSFSQYVAPSVLGEIERRGYRIELGGETRDVTVMFSDIRNFTPLAERLDPPALVALLNELFTALTARILARDGTIDKYIGDNVMAFWNAPLAIPGHEAAAARAALDMRRDLRAFCAARPEIDPPVELATGLATGEVLVGNIGSSQRFNYSVLGDNVNVAARAEAACRPVGFDILATAPTRDAAPDLAWLYAGSPALKGKSQPIALYLLVGDEDLAGTEPFLDLAVAHEALVAAIRTGDPTGPALATCRSLAPAVEPALTDFYDRLPARTADFRPGPDQSETGPG